MNQIRTNERFAKVQRAHKVLSAKYGDVVIAGGCLVDCYFNKDFYDIDCFITVDGLKDEFKKEYTAKGHLKDVLRDEVDGEAIDIIVLSYSVSEHINRFDQNFKKIYYNGKLHINKKAAEDLTNNEISLGSFNGPVVYFRCIKSSMKYNMPINETDLMLMQNYLDSLDNIRVAKKYNDYVKYYHRNKSYNEEIVKHMKKAAKSYWNLNRHFISISSLKKRLVELNLI
jgi:hypothetical protein